MKLGKRGGAWNFLLLRSKYYVITALRHSTWHIYGHTVLVLLLLNKTKRQKRPGHEAGVDTTEMGIERTVIALSIRLTVVGAFKKTKDLYHDIEFLIQLGFGIGHPKGLQALHQRQ